MGKAWEHMNDVWWTRGGRRGGGGGGGGGGVCPSRNLCTINDRAVKRPGNKANRMHTWTKLELEPILGFVG